MKLDINLNNEIVLLVGETKEEKELLLKIFSNPELTFHGEFDNNKQNYSLFIETKRE